MKRVIIIGCPGSGKSTLSIQLAKITGLPLCHLDNVFWNADKTTISKEEFAEKLKEILKGEEWILDGNFASTMEMRLQRVDTAIFLDYPTELCLESVRGRIGKFRPDIPWIEEQEDVEFMDYIRSYNETRRPAVLEIFSRYPDKKIYV